MTYFDNIGKYIPKSYRVLSQKYIQPDIVTATLHIRLGEEQLQKNEKLKPGNCRQLTSDEKSALIEEEIDRSNRNFRKYRLEFIAKMLTIIESESRDVEKKQQQQQESRAKRECTNEACKKQFTSVKNKCDSCKSKVEKTETEHGRFTTPLNWHITKSFMIGQIASHNFKCQQIGEPIMVNPNSFDRAKHILDEYKLLHKIGVDREWVILGCDGPPFRMASIMTQKEPQKYDWVYFVPGLGHLHMNQLITILKIMDTIMLQPLGKEVLNFKSPKAYQFVVHVKDTQKAYQTLLILLFGTAAEFRKKYIQSYKNRLM